MREAFGWGHAADVSALELDAPRNDGRTWADAPGGAHDLFVFPMPPSVLPPPLRHRGAGCSPPNITPPSSSHAGTRRWFASGTSAQRGCARSPPCRPRLADSEWSLQDWRPGLRAHGSAAHILDFPPLREAPTGLLRLLEDGRTTALRWAHPPNKARRLVGGLVVGPRYLARVRLLGRQAPAPRAPSTPQSSIL